MRTIRSGEAARFIAAIVRFGGSATLPAALLVVAGSMLEGVGLALLLPVLALLVPAASGGHVAGRWLGGLAGAVPAAWVQPLVLSAFCAVVAVRAVVLLGRDRRIDRLAFGFADAQRRRVISALANASWAELTALRHSQISHILSGEVTNVATATNLLPQIAVAALMATAQFAVLVLISPPLAGVALLLAAIGGLGLARLARSAVMTGAHGVRAGFRIADQVAALLGGLKFAAAHGLRHDLTERASAEAAAMTAQLLDQRRRYTVSSVVTTTAAAAAGVTLVAVGTALRVPGVALIAGLAVMLRMSGPLRQLQATVPQLAALLPSFAAVSALCATLERSAEPDPITGAGELDDSKGAITLTGVSFAYPGAAPVLAGVDFTIHSGELIGLAGPSGVGKTSLLDLLAGLRAPDAGIIAAGSTHLDAAHLLGWRRRLAYLTQDTYLFDDSLRHNLAWGIADGSDEAALQASLVAVGLDTLIAQLPEGLDTRVGERALRFSGGQRQRVALARAILRRPRLVLLDEATGALDAAAERTVLADLRRALPGAAMVLVSHRPEALALCDRVVMLVGGRIEEVRR